MNSSTIQEILRAATKTLRQNNIQSPRLDAEVILAHQLHWERIKLITHNDSLLDQQQQRMYVKKIEKRAQGMPVQYIIQQQEFMGLNFFVCPDVLIPRPDTEILVEAAIEQAESMKKPLTILDIGTGSGAVALSLAYFIKEAQVHTVDISAAALKVAQRNAIKLFLQDRVQFYCGDLFFPLGEELLGQVDLLVSNPPYIPKHDIQKLQQEIAYEPALALDGGIDGLDFYRKIIAQGQKFLSVQGKILLEVGQHQAHPVSEMLEKENVFQYVIMRKDLAGIKRVVIASRNSEETV